jgi:hypothetical protein
MLALINARFSSSNVAKSTRGIPTAIFAHAMGSNIQPAMQVAVPVGPSTSTNWPVALCSTRRTRTLWRKSGCHW